MSKKIICLVVIIVLALILSVGFCFEIFVPVNQVENEFITFEVKTGETSRDIATHLAEENIVRDKYSTYVFSILKGHNYYANTYVLSRDMNVNEVMNVLMNPQTNINKNNGIVLTIVEGDNLESIAQNIAKSSEYTKEEILQKWTDELYLESLIENYWFVTDDILNTDVKYPLEGLFTPQTYLFTKDSSIEDITESLLDYSNQVFSDLKPQDMTDEEFYQVLILASIVERETNNIDDQKLVAGVFANRLNQDMPLQADITVIYSLGKHKNIVTFEDLEVDSPYNLYQNKGLTPSPIASPSISAIDAVLNPVKSDYLYYYNTPDTGETLYSKTYKEHQQTVSQYQ